MASMLTRTGSPNEPLTPAVSAAPVQWDQAWWYGLLRYRTLAALLAVGTVLVLAQAFVPFERFIQRGDDAYYYFAVAANFPRLGYWSFDGLNSTNGVQPLWAIALSTTAQALDWLGLQDRGTLARIFVAMAAAAHAGSCVLLALLLARFVSVGTAIIAAGAFLLPLGIVWQRVWGLENGLYALLLLATIGHYHVVHLARPAMRTALVLGALLGLTTLARLNAGLLIPCLLAHLLLAAPAGTLAERFRQVLAAGTVASLIVGAYLGYNLLTTGHPLPVSGAVKQIATEEYLAARGLDTRFSLAFLKALYWGFHEQVFWFLTSRGLDGLWAVGGRVIFAGNSGTAIGTFAAICGAIFFLPGLLGRPGNWAAFLLARLRRLAPFGYVLAFAAANAILSVALYPTQLRYAMIRWWLAEGETVVVVLMATVLAAALHHLGSRLLDSRRRAVLVPLVVAVLAAHGTLQHVRTFWLDGWRFHDWNASWNDASHLAAEWLRENAPHDALVGSWNAGVLGYYASQRVVNLDGLINGFELLPYLRERRLGEYIRTRGIRYVSDMQSMFEHRRDVPDQLDLELVYRRYNALMRQEYRIYRVRD